MRYACLLRGINVGGHRKLGMAALLALCADIGLTRASSLLQSGNLLVDTALEGPALESLLQAEILARFGHADVDVMAWTGSALDAAVAGLPAAWRGHDRAMLHVTFLKDAGKAPRALATDFEPDAYALGDRVAYVYCPNGYGRTKLDNRFFERLLGTRATTRNWNTTLKLLALAAG